MAIRLSGLISGLDTDTMIEELVSAYSTKKDNIYKEQKTLSYKQDAWKTLNTKIYSLFSGKLSNLRFSANYVKKATSVSDTTKATVTASSTAVNGTQELKIAQLARSGYLTGAKLDGSYTNSSKMSEFGVTGTTRLNVSVNGKDTFIDVTTDMSVDKFVSKLKETGLNASFDANNQRFFVSSKESGADADFSLSGNSEAGNNLLKQMGLYSVSTADIDAYKNYISAAEGDAEYMSNLAKNEYLNSLLSARKSSIEAENTTKQNTITANNSKIKEYNSEISFAKSSDQAKEESLLKVRDSITSITEKIAAKEEAILNETDETKKEALTKEKEALEKQLDTANEQLDKYTAIRDRVGSSEAENFDVNVAAFEEEKKASIATVEEENKTLEEEIEANKKTIETIQSTTSKTIAEKEEYLGSGSFDYSSTEYTAIYAKYEEKLNNAKAVVSDYEKYETLKSLGATATDAEKAELTALTDKLGLTSSSLGATRITGSDAVIYLNGAEFTSTSNNFQINGLTITANAVTADDETISVTTTNDVDGIYNMVKEFFTEYNALINEMDALYNAESAGDYEPLTEDEESELSETQVEKWEKKLTDAALRKDDSLSTVINLMKNAMSQNFSVDGKSYSLSSFGIKTLGYFVAAENEKGAYHIDGDADDSSVSGNEDKLRAAIASDPDTFVNFFTQLTANVYNKLNTKMASSSLSSAYTVYNDKFMKTQYTEYTTSLSQWDEKIEAMREKYVKQFSAMESALASLNSQQSQLSSLLGNS